MTREETISELKTRYFSMSQCLQVEELHKANEAIDLAIEALQTDPCEDCISRQRVLDIVEFLEFLFNVINPNEMEHYISMYHCKEEKSKG